MEVLMRRGIIALLSVALVFVAPATPRALPEGLRVQTYRGNLNFPIDMAWVEGTKRIFFTEKNTGMIRVMIGRDLLGRPCRNLDVNGQGERGALGIALHPNFKENHFLYVFYTNASPLEHRVTRFTVRDNRCRNKTNILTNINASSSGYHNGGQLEFMKGKLFVSTGDAHQPSTAQQTGNRLGKILRYDPDGSVPNGNPFGPNNPVWSYGHRNPFGLTHEPGTRHLFSTENGPECDDELNDINPGRNYGWGPGYDCGTAGVGPNPKPPLKRWGNIVVPTDPFYYEGRLRRFDGKLFVGDYSDGRLHRFLLNDAGSDVRRHHVIHTGPSIVDVAKGPGGWLYFLTPQAIKRIRS
jgi:glucose/arabinose dehydrogenase